MIRIKTIEILMQKNNLSLSKLSSNSGIQKSTLSRLLSGETRAPTSETIRALANYFSIPISELLEEEDERCGKISLNSGSLVNNLRALMLNASILTAKDLSRATGIPTSNIERILNGSTHNPHLGTLNELANYFRVDISQLRGYEPLEDVSRGQINPFFSNIPIVSLSDLPAWREEKISPEILCNFVRASRKFMGKKSFSIIIDCDNYNNDFKKNYILVVDSDIKPDEGDYIIASIQNASPSIYEFSLDLRVMLREAGTEEYLMIDKKELSIYGVVVEIKLKQD